MANPTRQLRAKRAIEDRAARLGAKRQACESALDRNTNKIIDLLREGRSSDVPLRQLASLLGVSRQTLYRWLEIADQIPPGQTAAQWAARPSSDARKLG